MSVALRWPRLLSPASPRAGREPEPRDVALFGGGGPGIPRPPRGPIFLLTLFLHVAVIAVLVLGPLMWPDPPPDTRQDYLRVLIYDPPPPPPPPLPKGSPFAGAPRRPRAETTPTRPPSEAGLTAPSAALAPAESVGVTVDAPGSPGGSESGVPEGMEEGVEGGVAGGVPGGVVGGVLGGTGTGPVPVRDYDRPPRVLRQVRPTYPQEAFVKKVQGTVMLEIVIDETGRVARARVLQSVPGLDAAALETVRQWAFVPAFRRGKPVASVAFAPVTFRIF